MMKAQHTPTVNLENLTCAICCCISPDNTDGDDQDIRSRSDHPEVHIHRPEESGEFLFPDKIVYGSKTGDTPNKVQGHNRLVGNIEVIHPVPGGENKI